MLAQNFMTADALGISTEELDALIKVLGMLERGELRHSRPWFGRALPSDEPGFNMVATVMERPCGTVACLCGWANLLIGGAAFPEIRRYALDDRQFERFPPALIDLFGMGRQTSHLDQITPEEAAIALRNYLTTGEPRWSEALALS